MRRCLCPPIVAIAALAAIGVCAEAAQERAETDASRPTVGPRGPVGPDVPLDDAEKKGLDKRAVVEGRTAAAVQAACERAIQGGLPRVFLPAGQYVLEAEVRVPQGLTLLGEGSRTLIQAKAKDTHLFCVNGALDWSSPKRLGKYVHKPGVRKTHWEFIHNRVGSNGQSAYELCVVDTHPGMDGTFAIEGNLFEGLRHAIGIRDGSGLIRGNLFRNFRGKPFRPFIAISIAYGTHNNVPVEGCMPHDIRMEANVFSPEGAQYEKHSIGKAENIVMDGQLVPETKAGPPAPPPLPLLLPMDAEGKLGIRERPPLRIRRGRAKSAGWIEKENRELTQSAVKFPSRKLKVAHPTKGYFCRGRWGPCAGPAAAPGTVGAVREPPLLGSEINPNSNLSESPSPPR